MPETEYMWDELSDNVVAEYDDGVLTASYTHEPGRYGNLLSQNRSGTTQYYHYDGSCDMVALTNDMGDITDTNEYDAWGNVIGSTGTTPTPYKFLGKNGNQSDSNAAMQYARTRYLTLSNSRWTSLFLGRAFDGYQFHPVVPPIEPRDKTGDFTVDFGAAREGHLECCSIGLVVKFTPSAQDRYKFQRIDLRAYVRTHVALAWPCADHHNGRPPGDFGPDDWENTNEGYRPWHGSGVVPAIYDDYPGWNVSTNPEISNQICPGPCRVDGISQEFEICAIGVKKGFGRSERELLGCVKYGWKCEMSYQTTFLGVIFGPCFSCRKSCNITVWGEDTSPAGDPSTTVGPEILEWP